jgi:hypothetical protein
LHRTAILSHGALTPSDFHELVRAIKREVTKLKPSLVATVDLRGTWLNDLHHQRAVWGVQKAVLASQAGEIGPLLGSNPLKIQLW